MLPVTHVIGSIVQAHWGKAKPSCRWGGMAVAAARGRWEGSQHMLHDQAASNTGSAQHASSMLPATRPHGSSAWQVHRASYLCKGIMAHLPPKRDTTDKRAPHTLPGIGGL